MAIPAQPLQIIIFVIFPISVFMMHGQNSFIFITAHLTFLGFSRFFQQFPVNRLSAYPVRRIFSASAIFIFP